MPATRSSSPRGDARTPTGSAPNAPGSSSTGAARSGSTTRSGQGAIAARNALTDGEERLDYRALPRVTFTHPQVAAVGLTDAQAQEQGLECECRTLPLEAVPRALVNLDARGFVKIVAERESGRIVGATAAPRTPAM